jgi:hypothetical protein
VAKNKVKIPCPKNWIGLGLHFDPFPNGKKKQGPVSWVGIGSPATNSVEPQIPSQCNLFFRFISWMVATGHFLMEGGDLFFLWFYSVCFCVGFFCFFVTFPVSSFFFGFLAVCCIYK